MKPIKTYLGITALSASALIFGISCQKTLDEKDQGDVARLETTSSVNCTGITINLQTKQNDANGNFFWIGAKSNLATRQNFSGTNFSDNKYFDVVAAGGDPFHNLASSGIGVKSAGENSTDEFSINAGQQLWFTLSSAWADYKMSGFDLILHGNLATDGRIELYKNGNLVQTIPVQGTTTASSNFGVSFQTPNGPVPAEFVFFDQVRFICDAGRFHIRGPQGNQLPVYLPTAKFYLANTVKSVYMRNQSSGAGAFFGYTNTYINQGFYPGGETNVVNFQNNRQYKAQVADETPNSGEYNVLNPNKWLKITSSGGGLFYKQFRIGVGTDDYIQSGESITIEPGTDFPSGYFGSLEFREATVPNTIDKLDWKAYDGMTLVASGQTSGVDQNYNFINPGVKFNKVVISGISMDSKASLGRPSNQVISAYPSCPE